jgi:predicted XRE-type DNA-binding protein
VKTIEIKMSDLMYDSLTNFIENTQYCSIENYIHSILNAIVPVKRHSNKNTKMKQIAKLQDRNDVAVKSAGIEKLLVLMKEHGVLQKDLATVLGISTPAVNIHLKNTKSTKTKLRKAINENGVEGVFISAFLETCRRTGVEYFQLFLKDKEIPFELDNNLAHISYGYCVLFFEERILSPFEYYKIFQRTCNKSALNCDRQIQKMKKSLEKIILKIYKETGENKSSSFSFKNNLS